MKDYRPYQLELVIPPEAEPISLEEAKLYLRVDGEDEDTVVTAMVAAARIAAEQHLRRSLMTQNWRLAYDDYLLSETWLPMGRVQSVGAVNLINRDGGSSELDSGSYYLNARRDTLICDATPFSHRIEVVYTSGYGDAEDVPEPIRQGLFQHIAALYENRSGNISMPEASKMFYAPYRVVRI